MSYLEKIDTKCVPSHIAIIMDGNGRWAKEQGKERCFGHQVGAETVDVITRTAAKIGVKYLTLYTFSTENWNRPEKEVTALMALLFDSIKEETFMKNNVRFRIIGEMEKLPPHVQKKLQECISTTAANTGMQLVLALSYSSRWEITHTVKEIARMAKAGEILPEDIDETFISQHLTTSFMPDPDLVIRTGGEIRLSNYLLWQSAYSELYFCNTYWPEFREELFYKAIYEYQQRERRFGKTSEQVK